MMHMTIYWSRYVTLLIDQWKTDDWTSYLLTLVACFVSSSFYQYLENRRLRFKSLVPPPPPIASSNNSDSASTPLIAKLRRNRLVNQARIASTALFGINSALGYLLMLAVMSFNGGVFLAIVAGLTVGYYFFRFDDVDGKISAADNPCTCA